MLVFLITPPVKMDGSYNSPNKMKGQKWGEISHGLVQGGPLRSLYMELYYK